MKAIFIVRWIIVVIALVLGLVLVARGNVFIGLLVCALALSRIALFMMMVQRRKAFRERMAHRRDERQGGDDRWT